MKGILIHIFTSLMILQGAQAMERIGGSCIQSPSQMDSAHSAALSLGKPFMHHMVLQSGVEIPVWGSSVPNATITVEAANQKRVTRSMKDGSWQVWLAPMKPGKPFQIRVSSDRGDKLLLEDLLAGDVWLCAGQSNMEFPLERSEGGKAAIDHSQNRSIRLFQLKGRVRPDAVVWDEAVRSQLNRYDFFEGSWKVCDPSSCHDFSAIGCYFGFCMEAERKVPVGLISLSVGGAPLEAFMDSAVLRETSEVASLLDNWKEDELLVPWCRERVALNLGKSDKQQLHPFGPGYIFRAGVKQITGLPIRGVLWYQGESNAEKPDQYRLLFPKMVQSWRRSWQQEQLPFLVVQLSSIQRPGWEQFRDMQRSLSEEIPHCSLVVSSDLGDSLNVHPIRKKEIGERLAAQVLTSLYGLHNYRISPRPVSAKVQGQTIVVSFDPVSPLTTRDGKSVRELEMSDEMGCFVPVQGEIQDNQLILAKRHSSQGTIRYGWKPFSRGNLVSSGMLPVSTFQIHYNSEISNHWHYGKI